LVTFTDAVFDRFLNPFIKHKLESIALNSISKFKVRVLPSLLNYTDRKGRLPTKMVFVFACLIRFYKGDYNDRTMPINDDKNIVLEMSVIWQSTDFVDIAKKVLGKTEYWGQNLNLVKGLTSAIATSLELIEDYGIEKGFSKLSSK